MNFIKRMVIKWVRDDWDKVAVNDSVPMSLQTARSKRLVDESGDINMDNAIRFNVVKADGGLIVETKRYDHKRDRNDNRLHLIPEGTEDISGAIGKIVFMEFLQQ